jgi:alpha-beta hydrolase superfamily lysophospholipase
MSPSPAPIPLHDVKDEYLIDGIRVELYTQHTPHKSAPLICVHGGGQASWCWEDFAPVLQQNGFEVHALNWRGRNGSAAVDPALFLKASIADVVKDIAAVAGQF